MTVLFSMLFMFYRVNDINRPDWLGTVLYSLRSEIVLVVAILGLVFLLRWANSPFKHTSVAGLRISCLSSQIKSLSFQNTLQDVASLHLLTRNQSVYWRAFRWFSVLIFMIYVSSPIATQERTLIQIGYLLWIELSLMCLSQDSAIHHLRVLWLRGLGDRESLLRIWETRNARELVILNVMLFGINLMLLWWYSMSFAHMLILTGAIFALSLLTLYVRALMQSLYLNPIAATLTAWLLNTMLIAPLIIYSDAVSTVTIYLAITVIGSSTLVNRAWLKRREPKLDWLLTRQYRFLRQ